MITKERIEKVISPKLEQDNLFLVEISVSSANNISVLIDSDNGVSIDKCIEVSRLIESSIDREVEDFQLEVSSPGLGQPLKVFKQYQKNLNREVELLLTNGSKETGKLVSVNQEGVEIEVTKMVKPEGKKRKELLTETTFYPFIQIKTTRILVSFR
jgi:ribosome maturation factor RimP